MAAGIIQGTVTTTSGETIEMSWLVDNTGTPTKWYNASSLVNSAGTLLSDATGLLISTSQLATLGQAAMAASQPVVLASDQKFLANAYETVAASQTAQALGATGATGDWISGILVIPATTTPGVVTLLDNAISIPVFVGGASSVSNLVPFFIPLGLVSVSGAWKITTGANVSCIGIGKFT